MHLISSSGAVNDPKSTTFMLSFPGMRNKIKKLSWYSAVLCATATPTTAQTLAWTHPLPADFSAWVWAQTTTSDEGLLVTGDYTGSFDADPGPAQWLLAYSPPPTQRAFLARYDAAGALIWACSFGSIGVNGGTARGVAVDVTPEDSIYVIVECYGLVLDADPGPDTVAVNIDMELGQPIDPPVLVKLDPNGSFVHALHLQGHIDAFPKVVAAPGGGALLAGVFSDTLDMDPGPDTLQAINGAAEGQFLVRLDAQCTVLWSAHLMGACNVNENTYDLVLDRSDTTFVLATTVLSGTMDLDPGPGTVLATAPAGKFLGALARYDDQGQLIWGGSTTGTGNNIFRTANADDAGNVRIGGSIVGNADLDIGPGTAQFNSSGSSQDALLVNYDHSGQLLNATLLGDASLEFVWDIAVDEAGNAWAMGGYGDTTDLDPGPGVFAPPHHGNVNGGDLFLTHHTINGDLLWGGSLPGPGALVWGYVSTTANGMYGAGSFGDSCEIDPTSGVQWIADNDHQQGFIFRLNSDPTTSIAAAAPHAHALCIAPNPSGDQILLSLTHPATGPAQVRIYDARGRMHLEETVRLSDGRCPLRTHALVPGPYVLTLLTPDGRALSLPFVRE